MASLYVATLTVIRELDYIWSLPYLCIKNETMAPLHVAPLYVATLTGLHLGCTLPIKKRELFQMDYHFLYVGVVLVKFVQPLLLQSEKLG